MAKWKVNKERINTDIPSADGTIQGGSVTYATKRLIVDAAKKVGSYEAESEEYVKTIGTEHKREDLDRTGRVLIHDKIKEMETYLSYGGDKQDVASCVLHVRDTLTKQNYQEYDEVTTQVWVKEVSSSRKCVDDTTCKFYKEYTQQVVPSTAIIKTPRCEGDEGVERDVPKGDAVVTKVNISDVKTEVVEEIYDEFIEAIFQVYFETSVRDTLYAPQYKIKSANDYEKWLDGTLGNQYVTDYPTVDGETPLFWYMAANESVVENGTSIPDEYKYGGAFQKVDAYKHSGIHFYPYIERYEPYTMKAVFHSPNSDAVVYTASKTLSTSDEYNSFINGTLAADYAVIPQTLDVDGYMNQPIAFWVLEDKWDRGLRHVKVREIDASDMYGDTDGKKRVNVSDHTLFGDKTELHFYPYIGVGDVNHIVVSFNMGNYSDLDNCTALYDADTGEKLLGPVGWLCTSAPEPENAIYQYGYDADTETLLRGLDGSSMKNYFFGHSGDNIYNGFEGVYVYVRKIDEAKYSADDVSLKTLCPKSIQEIYPTVKRFKIKMYGEWHKNGNAPLGSKAHIDITAYQGGYSTRKIDEGYYIHPLTLANSTSETLKTYNYGGNDIDIWARSHDWSKCHQSGGVYDMEEMIQQTRDFNEVIYPNFDKVYDFMGYIFYDTLLQVGEYVEPIIVGKRSGEYAAPLDETYKSRWEGYPFYADPDDYDISLTAKSGYIEASHLDGTVIYVKKK